MPMDGLIPFWESKKHSFHWPVSEDYRSASLFLPAAGYRSEDELYRAGEYGYYWLRSLYVESPGNAYGLYFGSDFVDWGSNNFRYDGKSVRAVRVSQHLP